MSVLKKIIYMHAVVLSRNKVKTGNIFISRNINTNVDIDKASRNLNHKRKVYV